MTLATKLTPETLLAAPRRSAGVPNSKGTLALHTVSTYSFETHSKSYAVRVMDIESGTSTTLFDYPSLTEPTWISETRFLMLRDNDGKSTSLVVADATKAGEGVKEISTFNGSLSNLKAKQISDETIAFAVSAVTTPSGAMHDPASEPKKHSTAKVYSKIFVRHWDTWKGENISSIWYGALKPSAEAYALQDPGLVNALAGTKLECPVPPFGDAGDFDISASGLVFVSSDPQVNPALWTKTDLYYVPLSTFTEAKPPAPQMVKTGKLRGYTASPVFSHDGRRLAFKRMRHDQYESDKPRLLLLPDVKDLSNVQEFYRTDDGEGGWDARPDGITWSNDDAELYVTAEAAGHVRLHKLPSSPLDAGEDLPEPITSGAGSVGEVYTLSSDKREARLFVSGSSLVDSSTYTIVDPSSGHASLVSSNTKQGKSFGLSHDHQASDDFWFQGGGGGDYKAHALVVKPSHFDPSRRYPLALLIHGGPQGAWNDAWSTRWNPAVFAEQGYVVVCPNPTGSTGYGQAFTDAIATHWGGRPYDDLSACLAHIDSHLPYVDTSRAVALGASYGGYMINWLQGHPLGRRFRALVCHDGIFSTLNNWATEELFFVLHDMGGPLWEARDVYERWDPARFTGEWATPQLVVHSELDYRLPISEGLAAFNVLQARGVPSKLVVFPDENHWVLKPENSLVWHKEVLGWINKYVGLDDTGLAPDVENTSI